MAIEENKEKCVFQTEVKQLLHLMIHSLYSHPEIFLRELISNASDAADKLRFAAIEKPELCKNPHDLNIHISFNTEEATLVIEDNGIGMNREEVITHLGTIARSGTGEFLKKLSGDQKKDAHLIGQFGVGFYSVFIVAKKVMVETCKAGEKNGVCWISDGTGEFEVKNISKASCGTKITIFLKKEHKKFANDWTLRSIIRKYSDHISIPVMMLKAKESVEADDKKEGENKQSAEIEWEKVNTAKALWTCPRTEISDEEYKEFYKHISHDYSDPLYWSHNKIEGKLDYTSLLYIPSKAPFDIYSKNMHRGLKLYVQRTYIMDNAEHFLPMYLRFVKGIIDSNDLPLNISRELLQQNEQVESLKSALTKRVLSMLEKFSKKEPEKYREFWSSFGQVLKEGPSEDSVHSEKIAQLFLFSSTKSGKDDKAVSLNDYIGRMKKDQKHIYYLCTQNYASAASNPHLEIFNARGIEVLILSDRIDEWLMSSMHEFDKKQFKSVTHKDVDLNSDIKDEVNKDTKEKEKTKDKENDHPLIKRLKETLKEEVEDVQATNRLINSPVCLVASSNEMSDQIRQILEATGQQVPRNKPVLEINLKHLLIKKLENEKNEEAFKKLAFVLYHQAQLASGKQLENPGSYVEKVNDLLMQLTK